MNTLPKVEMKAGSLIPEKLYIWSLPHGEKKVVWLTPDKSGIAEFYGCDSENVCDWYFKDALVGELYGPFSLSNSSK